MRFAAAALCALGLLAAPATAAADPVTCPATSGSLELANPNSSFPGTQGSLRGDPEVRATYVCSYGERRNGQTSITGQTYIVSVSWAGSRATADDLGTAKGCSVTLGYAPSLEYASATRRAWADFNIAIEPYTAALRATTQALLAQAESIALACGATSAPGGGTTTTTTPPTTTTTTPPVTRPPAVPQRRTLRWRFRGLHVGDGFYVVSKGHGTARPLASNGQVTAERHATGTIRLSFYDGVPRTRIDVLGTNAARRPRTGLIKLSVHGPGNYVPSGDGLAGLRLVVEVDDVRGTDRMRRLCRAEPFGVVTIRAPANQPASSLGVVTVERLCSLEPFHAVQIDTDDWLPEASLQIAEAKPSR